MKRVRPMLHDETEAGGAAARAVLRSFEDEG